MPNRMVHLKEHVMCVIDTETTGLIAGQHDLVQICILPLDRQIHPLHHINGKSIKPFYLKLKPQRPWTVDPNALRVNGLNLNNLIENGVDSEEALDMFQSWFAELELPEDKKIIPLGQNYHFDRNFILEWLGEELYNRYFHYQIRDTMVTALYLNDRAGFRAHPTPLPKVSLKHLCIELDVPNEQAHDALQDCLATASVYRQMIGWEQEHFSPGKKTPNLVAIQ